MSKYKELIILDAIVIVIAIILFAPFALNWRGTLAAIVAMIAFTAFLVYNVRFVERAKRRRQLDSDKGTMEQALKVMNRYAKADVVGPIASEAKNELEAASRKQEDLHAIIESKFVKGTITYDKFASVVDAAIATITKNSLVLANRIQTFDARDYRHIEQALSSGSYRNDGIPDEIQEDKGRIYAKALADMNSIVEANERLLLELDRFAAEISSLDSADNVAANSEILEEVRKLIEETKFYK